jgi:hypothetical protein
MRSSGRSRRGEMADRKLSPTRAESVQRILERTGDRLVQRLALAACRAQVVGHRARRALDRQALLDALHGLDG